MDPRHKSKAIVGLVLWMLVLPVTLCVGAIGELFMTAKDAEGLAILFFLVASYATFFWGAAHLAQAKGYSSAMSLWGILCIPAQLVLLAVLLFALPDRCATSRPRSRKKQQQQDESLASRIVRYRRNALVANTLGVAGILLSLALIFIRTGLFESRGNEKAAAILVFLPSYAAILYGCWWWVKAKNWPDAVIFIGLMPLAPFLIPYVRILYIHILYFMTGVLPLLMVMMPILMIGVVAVLPDKSGLSKRKRRDRRRF